jgi:hypothetical protein
MDNVREWRRKAAERIDNRLSPSADEIARAVAKALKVEELKKIGNRSYVNAFQYPESKFDSNEPPVRALIRGDPLLRVQPYSYMIFQDDDGWIYGKNWRGSNEFPQQVRAYESRPARYQNLQPNIPFNPSRILS